MQGCPKCHALALLLTQGKISRQFLFFCKAAGVDIKPSSSYGRLMVRTESSRVTQPHIHCQEGKRPCLPSRGAGPSRCPDLVYAEQGLPLIPSWRLGFHSSPGKFSPNSSDLRKMLLLQTQCHKIALKWVGEGSLDLGLPREQEDSDENLPCALDTWPHLILTATHCIILHILKVLFFFYFIWSFHAELENFICNLYRFTQLVRKGWSRGSNPRLSDDRGVYLPTRLVFSKLLLFEYYL